MRDRNVEHIYCRVFEHLGVGAVGARAVIPVGAGEILRACQGARSDGGKLALGQLLERRGELRGDPARPQDPQLSAGAVEGWGRTDWGSARFTGDLRWQEKQGDYYSD